MNKTIKYAAIILLAASAAARAESPLSDNQIEIRGVALMPCDKAVRFQWWDNTNDAMGLSISSWILGYFTGLENINTVTNLLPGKENKTAVALVYQQCRFFMRRHDNKSVYDAALTIASRLLKKQINEPSVTDDPNTNLEID